jgi:hypothetical protein
MFEYHKKESPIISLLGMGGGIGSYVFTAADTGYEIARSLRFNDDDTAYLSRDPASAGDQKTWTWSGWVKRSKLAVSNTPFFSAGDGDSNRLLLYFNNSDKIQIFRNSGGSSQSIESTASYRDASAWYHIVVSWDAANSVASVYVNGVVASGLDAVSISNVNSPVNSTNTHYLGGQPFGTTAYFDGYLADVWLIDGSALEPTSFGTFDTYGVWQPKRYTGSATGNSFHLPFSDNSSASALGTDNSGNGNDWTVNNISVAAGAGNDSLLDSPTNGAPANDTGAGGEVPGNYATMSPNVGFVDYTLAPLSNGNLQVDWGASNVAWCDWGLTSGKWYYETRMRTGVSSGTGNWVRVGRRFSTSYNAFLWRSNGNTTGLTGSPTFSTYTNGDVLGVAIDVDNEQATFYKNGVLQGTGAYSYTTAGGEPIYIGGYANVTSSTAFNFGQRPYDYQNVGVDRPSAEFKALCTANLPTPTIEDPSQYVGVTTYTGNGTSKTISELNFSPDFVWIKKRNASESHVLWDTVRGATKVIYSESTSQENTDLNGLTSFNSNGFTYGSNGGGNALDDTYVAWSWDAGGDSNIFNVDGTGYSTASAAGITEGTTSLTGASVNRTARFSIVTFTAPSSGTTFTVGHGLDVTPSLVFVKGTGDVSQWITYHKDVITATDKYLALESAAAIGTYSTIWGTTLPTSTVVGLTADGGAVAQAASVMYSFAPVEGYSAFGSYVGADSNPNFIYTGFRPKYILVKETSSNSYPDNTGWYIWDSVRGAYNYNQLNLTANSSNQEGLQNGGGAIGDIGVDMLSNGFCLRGNGDAATNWSGGTYIYAAFAEHPFRSARAR